MVNYCCVAGCGANSRDNKYLNYYGLPKEKERQTEWLVAANRYDLLKKLGTRSSVSLRFCSRHFKLTYIKNRNLSVDAIPTLSLPGNRDEDTPRDCEPVTHIGIMCDNCKEEIKGFRYKCVTCKDYDLCMKCEMKETHSNHFFLRISRPLKFTVVDGLLQEWQRFFKSKHVTLAECESIDDFNTDEVKKEHSESSDDEPINKYLTRKTYKYEPLTEDVKLKIRNEVTRALTSIKNIESSRNCKRKQEKDGILHSLLSNKKRRGVKDFDKGDEETEVVFADVNDFS